MYNSDADDIKRQSMIIEREPTETEDVSLTNNKFSHERGRANTKGRLFYQKRDARNKIKRKIQRQSRKANR